MTPHFTLGSELDLLLPITALLPLTALLLVSQGNPYQTLVLRGILGSVATLFYALLGAPDVALTEAMVGTLLSTTLYAIALRSSMVLRLEDRRHQSAPQADQRLQAWSTALHLRLRLLKPEANSEAQDSWCHGWIEDGHRLIIQQPSLFTTLSHHPGLSSWQDLGGVLLLASMEE